MDFNKFFPPILDIIIAWLFMSNFCYFVEKCFISKMEQSCTKAPNLVHGHFDAWQMIKDQFNDINHANQAGMIYIIKLKKTWLWRKLHLRRCFGMGVIPGFLFFLWASLLWIEIQKLICNACKLQNIVINLAEGTAYEVQQGPQAFVAFQFVLLGIYNTHIQICIGLVSIWFFPYSLEW